MLNQTNFSVEKYRDTRDFDVYPTEQIDQLLTLEEFEIIKYPFLNYIKTLQEAGVEEQVISRVAHAVVAYLLEMLERGTPEMVQFLLPRTIDPYHEMYDGKLLIAYWEDQNRLKSEAIIQETTQEIIKYEPGELYPPKPAKTFIMTGSMFSEKTYRMLMVLQNMADLGWGRNLETVVAASMNESVIITRVGKRKNIPISRPFEIPAQQLDCDGLVELLNKSSLQAGDLVVIEEISFFAFAPEDVNRLLEAFEAANQRGIFILAAGLNSDFRENNFPLTDALESEDNPLNGFHIETCSAFHAYELDGGIFTANHASSTSRIDTQAGFVDYLLPVVIPRSMPVVSYAVAPPNAHPFGVLRECDPKVYIEIMDCGGNEQLFQHYVNRSES